MDDTTREQMVRELEALRAEMKSRGTEIPDSELELQQHVDSLHELVVRDSSEGHAPTTAKLLEQKLLAWEAEHPQLVAFATRVARALEDSGL